MSLKISGLFAVCFLLLAAVTPAAAQITVTPDSSAGWLIGPFGTPPPSGFVEGPGTPPEGLGSFFTAITDPSSKIILGRNDYHDAPLSELTALSYWTYIDPGASNTNNWYVNLYTDADGDGAYDTRLDYVPPSAMVMTGVWQQWDAFSGLWRVSTSGMNMTLADFLAANPNARFNAFSDPQALALRWNMGDTASSYVGFDGNLDGVRVAVNGVGDDTWDFEEARQTVAIPTQSPLGLALLATLLGLLAARVLRRRRAA